VNFQWDASDVFLSDKYFPLTFLSLSHDQVAKLVKKVIDAHVVSSEELVALIRVPENALMTNMKTYASQVNPRFADVKFKGTQFSS